MFLLKGNILRIVKCILSIIVYLFDALRCQLYKIIRCKIPGQLIVIYYHDIDKNYFSSFKKQIRAIKRWASPISALYFGCLPNNRLHVVVTFDDGLISFVDRALPILKFYNIPASIFVASGWLGKVPEWKGISQQIGIQECVLTAEKLRLIDPSMFEIGSHSITHPIFPELTNECALFEINESKIQLEKILRRPVKIFSFPYGEFYKKHINIARKAGYDRIFTTAPEIITSKVSSFVIGRTRVDPSDWQIEFFLKLHGSYRWLITASRLKTKFLTFSNKY